MAEHETPPRGKGDTDPELQAVEDEAVAEEGGLPLVKLGAFLLVVLIAGIAWAVISTRPSGPLVTEEARIAAKVKRFQKLLDEYQYDAVIEQAAAFSAEEGGVPAADELVALAHEGRMRGAFLALDPIGARRLMPDGWDRYFPELPWILALNGDAARAAQVADEAIAPEQRARLAAWGGDQTRCQQALAQLPAAHGQALAWELRAYLPALEAPPADLTRPAPDKGWEAVAYAEQALRLGLTGLAAIGFDNARRGEPDELQRLVCLIGLTRLALARGDMEHASEHVAEAFLLARHPLDRARALGWALIVTEARGEPIKQLTNQLGERTVLEEALAYGPGAPLIARAAQQARQHHAFAEAEDPESPLAPAGTTRWTALEQARAQRRAADRGAFTDDELRRCRGGEDGVVGQLVARGAELAAMALRGHSRSGASLALELLQRAAPLRPDSPALFVAMAQAELTLHRPQPALLAARRACFLAPGEPQAELVRAQALRAALETERQALGRAWLGGDPVAEQARALSRKLEPIRAKLAAALPLAADAPALAARLRLELGRTLAWRARWLRLAGDDDAAEADAAALAALQPLLDPLRVPAVAAARQALRTALREGTPEQVAGAEAQLAKADPDANLTQLDALLLAAGLGDEQAPLRAQAYVALTGDLPARALVALRRSEQLEGGARRDEVARGLGLADLPALRLAAACLRNPARDAQSFRELSAVIQAAPEWQATVLGIMFWSEGRLKPFTLEHFTPAATDDPDELLARAAFLRSAPVFGEHLDDLDEAEAAKLGVVHDEVSTLGLTLVHEALRLRSGDVYPHLLRAMFHSSVAHGSPVDARGDPRTVADVQFDLACARAAGPWSSATFIYHLHWAPDLVPDAIDELLAEGYTNLQALLNNTYSDVAAKILQPAAGLVNELAPGSPPDKSIELAAFLDESDSLPSLALALGLELADRPAPDPRWVEVATNGRSQGGTKLLGERPQVRLIAEARAELALARRQASDSLVGEAGRKALDALLEGEVAGDWLALRPRQRRALEVRPALPDTIRYHEILVAHGLPAHQDLWSAWHAVYRPEAALEWLADAATGLGRVTPDADPFTLAEDGAPDQAWIRALQESRDQERAVADLLAQGAWDEALATAERAAAFARGEPCAEVLRRLAAGPLRDHALAQEGPARAAALTALERLARRGLDLTADKAPLTALAKQLRADRGGE